MLVRLTYFSMLEHSMVRVAEISGNFRNFRKFPESWVLKRRAWFLKFNTKTVPKWFLSIFLFQICEFCLNIQIEKILSFDQNFCIKFQIFILFVSILNFWKFPEISRKFPNGNFRKFLLCNPDGAVVAYQTHHSEEPGSIPGGGCWILPSIISSH